MVTVNLSLISLSTRRAVCCICIGLISASLSFRQPNQDGLVEVRVVVGKRIVVAERVIVVRVGEDREGGAWGGTGGTGPPPGQEFNVWGGGTGPPQTDIL